METPSAAIATKKADVELYVKIIDDISKKPDGVLEIKDIIIESPLGKMVQLFNTNPGICSLNALCEILLFSPSIGHNLQKMMYSILLENSAEDLLRDKKNDMFKFLLESTKRILLAYYHTNETRHSLGSNQLRRKLSTDIKQSIREEFRISDWIIKYIDMLKLRPFDIFDIQPVYIRKFSNLHADEEGYVEKVVVQHKPYHPLKIISPDMYFMKDEGHLKEPLETLSTHTDIRSIFAINLTGFQSKIPHACCLIKNAPASSSASSSSFSASSSSFSASDNSWYYINNSDYYENISDNDAILLCMGKIIFVTLTLSSGEINLGILYITDETDEHGIQAHILYRDQRQKLDLEISGDSILSRTSNYQFFINFIVTSSHWFTFDSTGDISLARGKELEMGYNEIESPKDEEGWDAAVAAGDDEWGTAGAELGKKRKIRNKKVSKYKKTKKYRVKSSEYYKKSRRHKKSRK